MKTYERRGKRWVSVSDRSLSDMVGATASRPSEDMVIDKLTHDTAYPFDESLERQRQTAIDFTPRDWSIYLMLMHLAGRVHFCDPTSPLHLGVEHDAGITQERRMLRKCARALDLDAYDIVLYHAELLQKIRNRLNRKLRRTPPVPPEEQDRHRLRVQLLAHPKQ